MNNCTRLRTFLRTHQKLNLATGEITGGRREWVTEACKTPLFGDKEKQRGTCNSCHTGWTHPTNYPVEQPHPDRPADAPITDAEITKDQPSTPPSLPTYASCCAADSVLLDEWEDHHTDGPPPEPINQATLNLLAEHARVLDVILATYGAAFPTQTTAEYIHLLDRTIAHLMVEAPDLAKPLYKEITP